MTSTVAAQPTILAVPGKSITTFIVYEAVRRLQGMAEGEVLELTTDASEPIANDVAAWCDAAGHVLVSAHEDARTAHFAIRKGRAPHTTRRLAMIVSSPGLLDLLSPLGFALAAALEGIETHLYFQGPAVRVLKAGHQGNLPGWSRPFSRFARKGLSEVGHVPAQQKLDQLRTLGAKLYACGPSMERFKVPKHELIYDDVTVAEYLTFMAVMRDADITLYT